MSAIENGGRRAERHEWAQICHEPPRVCPVPTHRFSSWLHAGYSLGVAHCFAPVSAIAATLMRHNAIGATLSTKPESFKPLFVRDPDGEVDARPWCEGFYAVIKLRLLAWSRLMSPNAAEHGLLLPILFYRVDASGRPVLDAQRRGLNTPSIAREPWRDIPAVVEALRQFWMPTRFARGT
jgi:yecA family protein